MAETVDSTRRVVHAMLGTLMDCGFDAKHVHQVLGEYGFVYHGKRALAEREYQSWLVELRTPKAGVLASDVVERDPCDPSLLGKRIGYYPDGEPFGYITEQERADALAARGVGGTDGA